MKSVILNKSGLFLKACAFSIFVLLSINTAVSCGPVDETGHMLRPEGDTGKIIIVTTTGQIGDAAENVGGELVEVFSLMGPGVDPHLYKATARDVERLLSADVIFYNGIHLEGKMAELFTQMENRVMTAAVAGGIPEANLLELGTGLYDPHIWFDVGLWIMAVEEIRDTLVEFDPQNELVYRTNADIYLGKLRVLDQYVRDRSAELDAGKRIIITAHDAFGYFGRAYGFEVRGLQGISTVTEAGTGDVQELVNFIIEKQVPAIFVESSVPERNIDAVRAAVESRRFSVDIGGELFSDAMGDEGTAEGTYIGMVRHNIDTIVDPLKR